MDAFERVPLVIVDAPTGSGKTLVGETVRRMMGRRGLYICSSKGLQDQVENTFDCVVLKGRGNYPTELYPEKFKPGDWNSLSCEDCTYSDGSNCNWCSGKSNCPYEIQKNRALAAELAVLNTAYFLSEANTVGRFSQVNKKDKRLIIADEADTLEQMLMNYVSVEVSERRMKQYGWTPPKKVTVSESWGEWLDEVIPSINRLRAELPNDPEDVRIVRERKYLNTLRAKLSTVREGLESGYWVYTGDRDTKVSFKPSRVDSLGNSFLWSHGDRWLLMSATVISPAEMVESLGYKGEWESVVIPSTFPRENRKVVVRPVADLSKKANEVGKLTDAIYEILTRHETERVLLHSVSYSLTGEIVRSIGGEREVFTYTQSADRERAFSSWQRSAAGVLVAPSMDRGIDLPDSQCRVQVICKVPFPYLGDRQISARLHSRGGDTWYKVQTVRTIVQMCGRIVRNEDDWGVTYILDKQFNNLWNRSRLLFPKWWMEAVVWER